MITATIDIGNTRSKLGIFSHDDMVWYGLMPEHPAPFLQEWGVKAVMLSRVGQASWVEALRGLFPLYELSPSTPLPFHNTYSTPQTLGMDRAAAVAGAQALFPAQACLVVDMGTCITYDFITAGGAYIGGSISPGLQMRAKAMHAFTAKLPEITDWQGEIPLVGDSTFACLRSGAVHGVRLELEGLRQEYGARFGIFNTLLCGGDATFFERIAKPPIFARQEVVSIGLYAILKPLIAEGLPQK